MANGHGGARAGSGRKPRADEIALNDLLDTAWPQAERTKAIKAISVKAASGDIEAFKSLMAYAYGKPPQRLEHSGPDKGPIPISLTSSFNYDSVVAELTAGSGDDSSTPSPDQGAGDGPALG